MASRPAKTLLSLLLLAVMAMMSALPAQAQKESDLAIVVFHASWCASCRRIIPITQEVAGQKGMVVVLIDVDNPEAPNLAKSYGLSIPKTQPPQVYFVNRRSVGLLYDGKNYQYGQDDKAKSDIMQKLQNSSP